ncbi:gluconate 2-dehydrogenase subunit 3 family protein [Paenibacillus sp. sptzw28]|uniref:gluconate 2-dehydrogenase subunit 3 family protein n=1 Tax=Paenibacillus sp. sptzw28 TaxID=715179 RepID=UPI001C6F48B8|nr:gluconate 2-dehydrogenase subunit 3 family protein [Paenibacillus sp. sptzw28]QYR21820.1 gluconate 2-dehydrogenase subunit 3 family protein [Paenibacillus sp. sptzw28]
MHPAKSYAAIADPQTVATFRALVAAIVPNTPALAVYGAEQTAGAVDLHVDEYMIWELDHTLALMFGIELTIFPLSAPTAMLLNSGAVQFLASGQAQYAPNSSLWGTSPFAALAAADRIRVLAMLEQLNFDLGAVPPPYRDDGGFVVFIIDYLNRGTMFGFYSEWSAYGTTRLNTPTRRRLEYFPIGWRQVGYPGVSLGYRALRGFMLTIVREGGESIIV